MRANAGNGKSNDSGERRGAAGGGANQSGREAKARAGRERLEACQAGRGQEPGRNALEHGRETALVIARWTILTADDRVSVGGFQVMADIRRHPAAAVVGAERAGTNHP